MSKEFGGAWLDAVVLDMLRETGPIDPRWPKSEAPERQPGEAKRDFANRSRMYHDDWLEEDKKKQEAAVGALTAGARIGGLPDLRCLCSTCLKRQQVPGISSHPLPTHRHARLCRQHRCRPNSLHL